MTARIFSVFCPLVLCFHGLALAQSLNNFSQHSICRFSPNFTIDDIAKNSADFENNIFYWDGQFHRDGVGYQHSNGMTIDRVELGYSTGLAKGPANLTSNAKNEAYHIMLLAHAVAGTPQAVTFVAPGDPQSARQIAVAILTSKLSTYNAFNAAYPGYAGFLPPYQSNSTTIWPTDAWFTRVSAVDNGLLLWAAYGMIHLLRSIDLATYYDLIAGWSNWFVYARDNAKNVFNGRQPGQYCEVATLRATVNPNSRLQNYACEDDNHLLNDPYEGEPMAWFLYFSGTLDGNETNALWEQKKPQLQAVNYTGSTVDTSATQQGVYDYTNKPITGGYIRPITTQKGLYFASNEHIKLLILPYLDDALTARVFKNAERVRTCNSLLMSTCPGMFAEVTNATYPGISGQLTYIETAGVPAVASEQKQELGVITPYSVFPTILFDRFNGLAWYKTILDGKCMQTVYGSTAASRRDGAAVSAIVSWETKAPTLLALLGGITNFVKDGMKVDSVYDAFMSITSAEFKRVFDVSSNGGATLMGENVPLCLPNAQLPTQSLIDFSSCNTAQ